MVIITRCYINAKIKVNRLGQKGGAAGLDGQESVLSIKTGKAPYPAGTGCKRTFPGVRRSVIDPIPGRMATVVRNSLEYEYDG